MSQNKKKQIDTVTSIRKNEMTNSCNSSKKHTKINDTSVCATSRFLTKEKIECDKVHKKLIWKWNIQLWTKNVKTHTSATRKSKMTQTFAPVTNKRIPNEKPEGHKYICTHNLKEKVTHTTTRDKPHELMSQRQEEYQNDANKYASTYKK